MNKRLYFYLLAAVLCLSAFTFLTVVQWQPQEGSYNITFSSENASGVIGGLKGMIDFDKNNVANSKLDVTVDVNTLNTGNWLKNKHAKAESFLDAEHYPTIRFVSSNITSLNKGYKAVGNLTIKNVTKPVSIPFIFSDAGNTGKFQGFFTINRKDYNLIKDGIADSIKIVLTVPVTKQ